MSVFSPYPQWSRLLPPSGFLLAFGTPDTAPFFSEMKQGSLIPNNDFFFVLLCLECDPSRSQTGKPIING